jgi:hypothetical protein
MYDPFKVEKHRLNCLCNLSPATVSEDGAGIHDIGDRWPGGSVIYEGAEDGIRTRDPHLGKVVVFFLVGPASPQTCSSVHPGSRPSAQSVGLVEQSYYCLKLGVWPFQSDG